MATPPRSILPGQSLYLTIHAANRQFRFIPHKDLVDSIRFIFWYCAKKYEISVHEATWMSNHAHICLTDERGVLPKFVCQMNSLVSRQINALTGETGTNIEKGYSSIEIADSASMLRLSAYTLANPCAANLVRKASDWEGFCTYSREYNQPFKVERPRCGMWAENGEYKQSSAAQNSAQPINQDSSTVPRKSRWRRKPSKLPESVEVKLARPRIMPDLSDRVLRQKVRERTTYNEETAENKRKRMKKRVLGIAGILKQRSNDRPPTTKKRFKHTPLVAAESKELRLYRMNIIREFRQRYKEALDRFCRLGKEHARFPEGTWKMRTAFNVSCSPLLA